MNLLSTFTLFGVLVVLAPSVGASNEAPTSAGRDAVNGQRVFVADGCSYCHGTAGQGGGIAGPPLAPNPLPLAGIRAKLRTPSGRMPVFTPAVLTDEQIGDIAAFLQSIPPGTQAQDIALLNR